MEGKGEFDDTQVGPEVPAVLAHGGDDEVAHLSCQLLELGIGEPAEVLGGGNGVEKHC